MGKMKKLLSMLLAVIIILGTVKSVPVEAKSNKYYWMYSKQTCYRYNNGKWEESFKDVYKFNKKGDIVSATHTFEGSTTSEKKVYDKKGNMKKSSYYEEGKLVRKYTYKYNKNGMASLSKTFDSKGKLISTEKYKLDKKGNWTKCTITYTDKSKKTEVMTRKIKYNKNVIIKVETKSADGSTSIAEYYKNGNPKHTKYTSDDYTYETFSNKKGYETKSINDSSGYKFESTYTYKNGNKVKSVNVSIDKATGTKSTSTTTYKYKFDKNKNVLECVEYIDDQPTSKYVYSGYKKLKK